MKGFYDTSHPSSPAQLHLKDDVVTLKTFVEKFAYVSGLNSAAVFNFKVNIGLRKVALGGYSTYFFFQSKCRSILKVFYSSSVKKHLKECVTES